MVLMSRWPLFPRIAAIQAGPGLAAGRSGTIGGAA
jgi:hypothetical protein